jgi:HEPN domain-containing protein
MKELAREWVLKSAEDWRSAQVLISDHNPLVSPALFHLQQCAEKLLKALLIRRNIPFERRHDLSYLAELGGEEKLEPFSLLLAELSPFAVEFRYPGDLPVFSVNEVEEVMMRLADFREAILPLIES